jgi:large subunit ribosomal protein L1
MPKRGKNYQEAAKLVDRTRLYSPEEALELTKKTSYAKFDATVELHLRTGLDPRHADQQVRGVVLLPKGTGKDVRILVFAEGEAEKTARDAGADYVGSDELIDQIQKGWFDFDVAINIHVAIGKASFATDSLLENMSAVMEAIVKARPPAVKGTFIRKITLCNSMGPGIRVDPSAATSMKTL